MGAARRVSEPLQVERLDDGDRMLLRDLEIDLDVDLRLGDGTFEGFSKSADGTTVVTVPKGFTTDFSSIPAFARALYRFDSVDLAGCCHDYAYYVGVPRSAADEIWRLVAISGTRHVSEFRGRLGWRTATPIITPIGSNAPRNRSNTDRSTCTRHRAALHVHMSSSSPGSSAVGARARRASRPPDRQRTVG